MGDTLAQRVARRRAELNMGANELARAIGKSHSFMVQLQNGSGRPSEDTLRVILRVLDVPRDQHDEWFASAGIVPQVVLDALIAHPETWVRVRTMLAESERERS